MEYFEEIQDRVILIGVRIIHLFQNFSTVFPYPVERIGNKEKQLIMVVSAFAALVGNGGAPRASIFLSSGKRMVCTTS